LPQQSLIVETKPNFTNTSGHWQMQRQAQARFWGAKYMFTGKYCFYNLFH